MPPRANEATRHELHEEPSLWYSAPLLFAIVPAVGGVAFKKGSVLLTDVALLALAAVYLNWCLITPWFWYHEARSVRVVEGPYERGELTTANEETVEDEKEAEEDRSPHAGKFPTKTEEKIAPEKKHPAAAGSGLETATGEAAAELKLHELAALAMCIFGPLIGSYVLHLVRCSLSKLHGGQLVSNLHLTLFVLGAELRPIRHCMKLVQARTLYLQRTVRSDPHSAQDDSVTSEEVQDLAGRVYELEASFAESIVSKDEKEQTAGMDKNASSEEMKKVEQSLQTQVDALNRAVRRYEKRATAQGTQTEARLQDLETRTREALSLAATAAKYSQEPGITIATLQWLASLIAQALNVLTYPFRYVTDTGWSILKRLGLARPLRRKRAIERHRRIDSGSRMTKERAMLMRSSSSKSA